MSDSLLHQKPARFRRRYRDPQGADARDSRRAKCTRSWGRTAPASPLLSKVIGRHTRTTKSPRAPRSHGRSRTCSISRSTSGPAPGSFLAFQYPHEIPGVSNANFLRAARQARLPKGEEVDADRLLQELYAENGRARHGSKFTGRAVNEGFSGGEKKRNEILQMMMLGAELCVLDETDSGSTSMPSRSLLKASIACAPERGFLVITHYQRLLDYIVPDVVHVMIDGRIVRSRWQGPRPRTRREGLRLG